MNEEIKADIERLLELATPENIAKLSEEDLNKLKEILDELDN